MIYSADANSRLAKSRLAKSRSVSDKSLPERQLSTQSFPLGTPLGTGEPAQLAGDSRFEETEPPLPESRKDKFDLEQVDQFDLEQRDLEQRDLEQHDLELATLIDARIELRLPGRVRHLTVFTTENAVILSGECSTFYTKQVAQHAAMGVLEYEQLINNIDVRTAK